MDQMAARPQLHARICAVVPVQNEAASVGNVLRQLHRAGVHQVVIVANGCVDATPHVAKPVAQSLFEGHKIVQIFEALGPDVPKAIGTYAALRTFPDAQWFVYVDGDWKGSFGPMLEEFLIDGMSSGSKVQWIGLADTDQSEDSQLASQELNAHALWQSVLEERYPLLHKVQPSRTPLLVHRQTFTRISPYWLHHPGCWFAMCVLNENPELRLSVNTRWNSKLVGNPTRSREHALRMTETIFGDTVEGCRLLAGRKPSRAWQGKVLNGYHSERRMDILHKWQTEL